MIYPPETGKLQQRKKYTTLTINGISQQIIQTTKRKRHLGGTITRGGKNIVFEAKLES